jgi:hypothetical protein
MSARMTRAMISAVLGLAGAAVAQEIPPMLPVAPTPQAEPQPEPKPQPPKIPTLDDLLGLPKPAEAPKTKPRPDAADPTKTDLDRRLSSREVAEQFKVAVDLMGETADRIQTSRDTGLATQRLQEDIIRKLDQLIKSAEQNQQQSKSSSSSKGQKDQQQSQPNQAQKQRQEGQEPASDPADDTRDPPAGRAAELNPGTAARGAAWGALPRRERDALLQGNADKYSDVYRKWTEAYYRRLAEEGNK